MPAAWATDGGTWARAEKAVKKNWDSYDDPNAVVAYVYQQMGGAVKSGAAESKPKELPAQMREHVDALYEDLYEASSSTANGPLLRAGSSKSKESQVQETRAFRAKESVSLGSGKREIQVILISEGPGNTRDMNYYSARAIQMAPARFEGARCFLNHQTMDEEDARPEQDVTQEAGYFKNVKVVNIYDLEQKKTVTAAQAVLVCDESAAGNEVYAKAALQMEWKKNYPNSPNCYAGLSINSSGLQDGTILVEGEEWKNIVDFAGVKSVDCVTRPARGGALVALLESMADSDPNRRKSMKKIIKQLREAKAKLKSETQDAARVLLEAEIQKLERKVLTAIEAKKEAEEAEDMEGKEAEDGEDEDEDAAPDPDAAMDALKQHVPQGDGENDQMYSDRLGAIMGHAKAASGAAAPAGEEEEEDEADPDADPNADPAAAGKPAPGKGKGKPMPFGKQSKKESMGALTVEQFKKKYPGAYSRVRESVRKEVGDKVTDFKAIKAENERLATALRIKESQDLAKNKLLKANIPANILSADRLVRMCESGEAMDEEIAATKALMRGESFSFDGSGKLLESASDGNFDSMLDAAGVTRKGTKKNDE